MQELSLVEIFTTPLEDHGIPYLVTGSMASVVYGEPRLTHDVDLVLHLNENDVHLFVSLFPIEKFYCPPPEMILLEVRRRCRAHFNLIHHDTGFKADCYIADHQGLHQWAFDNKRSFKLSETKTLTLAPPEYVIVRKLEYFREGGSQKHIQDIQGMLKTSGQEIDLKIIEEFVNKLGLGKVWSDTIKG